MPKHYVIINDSGCVLRGFSDFFEQPNNGAICINEDAGAHFDLNGVINPPMTEMNGVPLYKFDGGKVTERTREEIDSDIVVPDPVKTLVERVAALETELTESITALNILLGE